MSEAIARSVDKVCVGVIVGPHGLQGIVRIKSFTMEPHNVVAYGPVTDTFGNRQFHLTLVGDAKGVLLARIEGVDDRNSAQALAGTKLFVNRHVLPVVEDGEYYHADLVGLAARLFDGASYGHVRGVHNFGAGDVLEIERVNRARVMLPFSRGIVPHIDVEAGYISINPPPGLETDKKIDGNEKP